MEPKIKGGGGGERVKLENSNEFINIKECPTYKVKTHNKEYKLQDSEF